MLDNEKFAALVLEFLSLIASKLTDRKFATKATGPQDPLHDLTQRTHDRALNIINQLVAQWSVHSTAQQCAYFTHAIAYVQFMIAADQRLDPQLRVDSNLLKDRIHKLQSLLPKDFPLLIRNVAVNPILDQYFVKELEGLESGSTWKLRAKM